MAWSTDDIPALDDTTWVITGANSGIGLETARVLAHRGAHVIFACRDRDRAAVAIDEVLHDDLSARCTFVPLDLANLASVRAFGDLLPDGPIDGLINNAGLMAIPRRETTDGFEMQLGVNHLGHFALTMHLHPRLSLNARVVHVSSIAHRRGRIDFDDLMGHRHYARWDAYAQSKLANLVFHHELARRLDGPISVACHPGVSATNLAVGRDASLPRRVFGRVANRFAQPANLGALPTLYAATHPEVGNGDFIGPDGFREMRGQPRPTHPSAASRDSDTATRLWEVSARLTGVSL